MRTILAVAVLCLGFGPAAAPAEAAELMTCSSTWTWTFTPALGTLSTTGTVHVGSFNNCVIASTPCGIGVCGGSFGYPYEFTGVYGGDCALVAVIAQNGNFVLAGGTVVTGHGFFTGQTWQAEGALGPGACDSGQATGTILATLERT